ncbi:hypothetical protein [Streptomyces sp. NPDC091027]|uniref:hypothetical protein n=1 Tax=Streptomyces sp. NPDC091027 TaxID=3365971 RepID=UPI003815CDE9
MDSRGVRSAQQSSFANLASHPYGASGSPGVREIGSRARTLYLGETEIAVADAGKVTGRTLSHLLADHHNAATISVDKKGATGLAHIGAREYAASAGRFVTVDPDRRPPTVLVRSVSERAWKEA